jgi:hypothetical protein
MTTNFFSPLSFVAVFGSGIRDPGSAIRDPGSGMGKNQDPGSGINIPDPQHWHKKGMFQCIPAKYLVPVIKALGHQLEVLNVRLHMQVNLFFYMVFFR